MSASTLLHVYTCKSVYTCIILYSSVQLWHQRFYDNCGQLCTHELAPAPFTVAVSGSDLHAVACACSQCHGVHVNDVNSSCAELIVPVLYIVGAPRMERYLYREGSLSTLPRYVCNYSAHHGWLWFMMTTFIQQDHWTCMHIHMIYLLLVLQLTFVTILPLAVLATIVQFCIYDLTTSTIITKVCVECNARALHPVRDSALHHII